MVCAQVGAALSAKAARLAEQTQIDFERITQSPRVRAVGSLLQGQSNANLSPNFPKEESQSGAPGQKVSSTRHKKQAQNKSN